jgi:hypothetical protein
MYVNLKYKTEREDDIKTIKSIILSTKKFEREVKVTLHIWQTNLLPVLSSTEVARNIPEKIKEQKHEELIRPHQSYSLRLKV